MLAGRDAGGPEDMTGPIQGEGDQEFSAPRYMTDAEARDLCAQLRGRLLDVVSQNGGHLASNLGAVELTVAIHRVFDTSKDRLVFDVGHQCYVHKMLTGRNGMMETLRTFGGVAGFPKPAESVHDAFIAGHASNAVSVALGMATARTRLHQDYHVLALLGDGALTGGLAYEGLSCAGQSGEPLIVILNDNGMSITKNVGGVARHLAHQRLRPQYLRLKRWYRGVTHATRLGTRFYQLTHKLKTAIKAALLPSSFFEDMGFRYMGPVDGHDLKGLTRLLTYAKESQAPVVLHVRTVKGKGYLPAEQNPDAFHGVGPFRRSDGTPLKTAAAPGYAQIFGETLCRLAREDEKLCAITAAMAPGTGLTAFGQEFPGRFFDVGIAEGHAVAMAAGMAKQGLHPVFAVYATFLQRGYDMLIHDVAIQGLHVVFCVDRAGLVGDDGETHHGLFDVAFLNTIPGMTVLCPSSARELSSLLSAALYQTKGPVAVRYPRGGEEDYTADNSALPTVCLRPGGDLTLVTYGGLVSQVLGAADLLAEEGIQAAVFKLNRITPLDPAPVEESVRETGRVLIAEEAVSMGSVGERVLAHLAQAGVPLRGARRCDCGTGFVTQGTVAQLRALCGLDSKSLAQTAKEVVLHGSKN